MPSNDTQHPRVTVLAAKAVALLAKPLDPPTTWAARVAITERLHHDGLATDTTATPRPGHAALRLARTVNTLAFPLNRLTFWAARIVTSDRLIRNSPQPAKDH